MNILKQSIILAHFLNLEQNESSIEARNTSLSGQKTRSGTSRACMTLMVFKNTLDAVDVDTPKQYAHTHSLIPDRQGGVLAVQLQTHHVALQRRM